MRPCLTRAVNPLQTRPGAAFYRARPRHLSNKTPLFAARWRRHAVYWYTSAVYHQLSTDRCWRWGIHAGGQGEEQWEQEEPQWSEDKVRSRGGTVRTGDWLRKTIISGEARKIEYRLQENKPFYHTRIIFAALVSTRHDNILPTCILYLNKNCYPLHSIRRHHLGTFPASSTNTGPSFSSSSGEVVPSQPSLSHPVPFHSIPFHPIPSHPIPSHLIPSHPIPSRPAPFHPTPSHTISSHPIPAHPVQFHPIPPIPSHPGPAQSCPVSSASRSAEEVQTPPAGSIDRACRV